MRGAAFIGVLALMCGACSREQPRVTIGAAAVLRHAMPELVERYRASAGIHVEVTYGASDNLAGQLERGIDLDGVVLAEYASLDALITRGRIDGNSKRAIARTTLVLVGPNASGRTFATLASMPSNSKIAIGDPTSVPAGRYARSYLQAIGVWNAIEPRLLYGGDVAGVLAHALRGTAAVAIVYRTDAERAALVILDEPRDAPVVSIVSGVVANQHAAHARAFFDFLASSEGQAILARHGFAGPR